MTTIHARQIQFAKMHIGKTTPCAESTVYSFSIFPTILHTRFLPLKRSTAHRDIWPYATVCAFKAIYWFFFYWGAPANWAQFGWVSGFPSLKDVGIWTIWLYNFCVYNEGNSQWQSVPFLFKLLRLLHPHALANIHCGRQAYTERTFFKGEMLVTYSDTISGWQCYKWTST